MAKYYGGKLTLSVDKSAFLELDDLIDTLDNLADNMKDELEADAMRDAATLADALGTNYSNYLQQYGSQGSQIGSVEEGASLTYQGASRINLNKYDGQWYGAPTLYVTKRHGGYRVTLNGKDILYHEFGTGMVGKTVRKYPFAKAAKYGINANWPYVVGTEIIRNYHYVNSSNANDVMPEWYTSGVESGQISKSAYVWMSPLGISEGNVAGGFLFKTISDYWDSFDSNNPNISLSKRTITSAFKKNLSNRKK